MAGIYEQSWKELKDYIIRKDKEFDEAAIDLACRPKHDKKQLQQLEAAAYVYAELVGVINTIQGSHDPAPGNPNE